MISSLFNALLLMAEILHQLISSSSVHPIGYEVLYIPGGAGFLASTVDASGAISGWSTPEILHRKWAHLVWWVLHIAE